MRHKKEYKADGCRITGELCNDHSCEFCRLADYHEEQREARKKEQERE